MLKGYVLKACFKPLRKKLQEQGNIYIYVCKEGKASTANERLAKN